MYELLGSKIKEMKVYTEGHLVPVRRNPEMVLMRSVEE
jgi:hypothetical protein